MKQKDLLYFLGREEEYFIAWGIENAKGEQMTINLENELYEILKRIISVRWRAGWKIC